MAVRLTPLEIQNMVFPRKKFGGLDEDAVKEFLSRVSSDYEELSRENRQNQEELKLMREKMGENTNLENALKDALLSAQKATGQLKDSARRESNLLIKESELKAEQMLDDARIELKGLTDEIRNYKTIKRKLKTELKLFLQSYMDLLESDDPK